MPPKPSNIHCLLLGDSINHITNITMIKLIIMSVGDISFNGGNVKGI